MRNGDDKEFNKTHMMSHMGFSFHMIGTCVISHGFVTWGCVMSHGFGSFDIAMI